MNTDREGNAMGGTARGGTRALMALTDEAAADFGIAGRVPGTTDEPDPEAYTGSADGTIDSMEADPGFVPGEEE